MPHARQCTAHICDYIPPMGEHAVLTEPIRKPTSSVLLLSRLKRMPGRCHLIPVATEIKKKTTDEENTTFQEREIDLGGHQGIYIIQGLDPSKTFEICVNKKPNGA